MRGRGDNLLCDREQSPTPKLSRATSLALGIPQQELVWRERERELVRKGPGSESTAQSGRLVSNDSIEGTAAAVETNRRRSFRTRLEEDRRAEANEA